MNNRTQDPLVSIIVRTKDRPALLKKALSSINAQTYRPVEVVLVNDGGCELDIQNLKSILGDVALYYIRLEKNTGRAHAGNTGLEHASGKYVGFLDDDDEFYPEHLTTLVSFMKQEKYKVVYADSLMAYKEYNPATAELVDIKKEKVFSQDFNYDYLIFENYIPFMCLLFEREVLLNSGGFDGELSIYEDWDLLIRIGEKHAFYHIEQITADYNQWDTELQIAQRNDNYDFMEQSYVKVLSKHIDKVSAKRILDYSYHIADKNKEPHVKTIETLLAVKERTLNDIYHSRGWRLLMSCRRLRDSLFPPNSMRRRSGNQFLYAFENSYRFLKNLNRKNGFHNDPLQRERHQKEIFQDQSGKQQADIRRVESGKLRNKCSRIGNGLLPEGTMRRLFIKMLLKVIADPKRVIRSVNITRLRKLLHDLKMSDPLTIERKIEQKLSEDASVEEFYRKEMPIQDLSEKVKDHQYFNFLFEMNTKRRNEYVPISYPTIAETDIKLIAYYLPQFHPIEENDEWWGKGFTEWMNVTRAVPQFIGHYQPRLPGELGFYDLRLMEVQKRQVELARQYGIFGFCFHFYWFNGKSLLEDPVKSFVENMDFPFCINWANENWTRRWDGYDNDILMAQKHSSEDDFAFIEYISKYLKNKNYIRINSKPLVILYRPALFPNPRATAERWRKWCLKNGIGEIYLAAVHSFEHVDPRDIGFDAVIEFPPNTFPLKDISKQLKIVNPNYKGIVFDYKDLLRCSIQYQKPPYKKFRGICPAWDNESRTPGRGTVLINSNPDAYQEWLRILCNYTTRNFDPEERLVFINAWNEWAESAYLEPDRRYGYAYLQATAEALSPRPRASASQPGKWKILFVSHDTFKGGAQSVLLDIITWFKRHTLADISILCLEGGELLPRFRELGETLVLSEIKNKKITEEELTLNLRQFCGAVPDLIYCNSVASGRAYQLLRSLDAPIIMHFHELEMSIKRYAADWIGDVLRYTTHFIAISGAVRENLVKNYGVDQSKISTVYSSIIPERSIQIAGDREKHKIRKRLGLEKNKFLVFGCGLGMSFRKGADLFMDVARILRGKGFADFHFYWIGDFDEKERDIRYGKWADYISALRKDGMDEYVTFLGIKDKPREYMQAGDVFLLSSREEPVGLVGLEAAESGLPIVCFADAGGMPDFVGDDAGFIVPYEDVEAMSEKVVVLMGNEILRQKLGARAREKVLSRFTVEHTTPHVLSECRKAAQKTPAVSVIIPNYNHARYLQKRLASIFNQTFKDFEIIILDDASTDNSMEVLNQYADHADVCILRNERNSGSPFRQWLKGLDLAKADVIWIAESDDMCEPEFLETLLPAFRNPEVKLAYSNSHVLDEQDRVTGDYISGEYLSSLSQTKWKESYLVSAMEEINDGLGVKDTVLNISAVLFRRAEFNEEFRKTLESMRIAGDWYFIVNAIKGGKVWYEAGKLNYHRRHSESVIGKMVSEKKMEAFFREFCIVQKFIFRNYTLDDDFSEKWERYLRKQWNDFYPDRSFEELNKYYPVDKMKKMILSKNWAA
jgi:glycosyltransferase involved in cell wall biosynthesis